MFKKISIAILIGLLGTIFFAQYDSWTHKKIIEMCQNIACNYLGGNFSCTIQSLSFFSPSIILSDIEMNSLEEGLWTWRCKKCEVNCSWLQLLFKGVVEQHVIINDFECSSRCDDMHCAIESHCMAMMQKSFLPFPTEVKSIIFKNAHFCTHDHERRINSSCVLNSSSLRVGDRFKTTMSIIDGSLLYEDMHYVEKITADISLITGFIGDKLDVHCNIAGAFVLSHMKDRGGCYLTGQWKSDHGRFSIRNTYNYVMIDPIIITENEMRINARLPLSYGAQCMKNLISYQAIDGTINVTAKISRDESRRVDGQIVFEDVVMNERHICDAGKIVFARNGYDWCVKLGLRNCNQECKGSGYWSEDERVGELTFSNATELLSAILPYWRINHNNFLARVMVDHDIFTGTFSAIAKNILSNGVHTTSGNFEYSKGELFFNAMIDDNELSAHMQRLPELKVNHCYYRDKDKKTLIMLEQSVDNKQQITGTISFPFVRSLIYNCFEYDLQGEGALTLAAELIDDDINIDARLDDSTIRLPQTYNFIDGFNARCIYNRGHKSCVFENINISLHTGTLNCLRASMYFDSQGKLIFVHAPLVLDRCLLNIKKDLFAIVSGNLLLSKNEDAEPLVSGHIIVDKAQLKENLFSSVIQKQLLAHTHSAFALSDVPVKCDLFIETKSPIRVDTALLQTKAKVVLHVQKDVRDPTITGSVVLNSGMLNFPYKPLYISKGIITFSPDQLFDSSIELIARNKIKKYDVLLQVGGLLSNHHIVLDATPPLSEEQIVGLLLVGSEENSLNSMMPALIVQNLKNFIFSNNQSIILDKYFKPLLRTFNINLVPSFTDQTGRGGLRGALEITIDDCWRAMIQKNFSLTEDTKFELEFLLSDDITLRAIRDERRDIGGEVEMRWKF